MLASRMDQHSTVQRCGTNGRMMVRLLALVAWSMPLAQAANVEGVYDPSFASVGYRLVDVSPAANDQGRILRIQSDGKLLMAGTCGSGAVNYFCATRLDPAGTIDLGFGPDGTGTITFDRFAGQGVPSDVLGSMLSLSDGRILFLGNSILIMLTADGKGLDTTVGGGSGYIGASGKFALAEQSDHKILVAGYGPRNDASGNEDMTVQRFLPDLSPDPDFGSNGSASVVFNVGVSNSYATSIAIQSNGSIVLAGFVVFTGQPGKYIGLSRVLSTGQTDSTFGGGWTYQQPYGSEDVAFSVRIDQKGRIVYGGYGATDTNFSTRKCVINRLLANGSQDPSFNLNQPQVFTVSVGGPQAPCEIVDVAPQPDGTVLAVGSLVDYYFVAARLTPAGLFDSTFGSGGTSYGSFAPTATGTIVRNGSMAIGNGLMIAGTSVGSDSQFGIAQLKLTVRIFANGFDN